MARYVLTDSEVDALQALQTPGESAAGGGPGGYPLSLPNESYPRKGTRQERFILTRFAPAGALEVYKPDTGDLYCGVSAGSYFNGASLVTYAGAENVALTNNQTNYVYMTAAGVVTVNTTGFPAQGTTPNLPLAIITTGTASASGTAGSYLPEDITDCRSRAMTRVPNAMTAANANTLVAGGASDADSLHTHATKVSQTRTISAGNGLEGGGDLSANRTLSVKPDVTGGANLAKAVNVSANGLAVKVDGTTIQGNGSDQLEVKDGGVSVAKLADAVQDKIPSLAISGADHGDGTGLLTVQVKDAAGNNLAGRRLVRVWIGKHDDYGADAMTAGFSVVTGVEKEEVTEDSEYLVITDATGLVEMDIANGAGTVYAWAQLGDAAIAESGAIVITSP